MPVLGPPSPFYPDEFSLLLQGETFAMGRLANPTHPLLEYFESVYVAQRPSYASMYFPGRGAPLALGILLFGEPWAGVWLSMIALSVATVWMLRGWVSHPLALLGGILVVLMFGVLSNWANSYLGGGFAALGGALVIGSFPRLMRRPHWRHGIALGAGLLILMVTRPYEGLLVSAPFLAAGTSAAFRKIKDREFTAVVKMILPTALLTAIGTLILLASNQASTGDMLVAPYSHNRTNYAFAPAFLASEAIDPVQSMPEQLLAYYQDEASFHTRRASVSGIAESVLKKARNALRFYVGPVLAIPFLIGLLHAWRYPVVAASGLSLLTGFLFLTWDWEHYLGSGFGLLLIVTMQGFARLRRLRFQGRPAGLFLARALPCIAAVFTLIPSAALYAGAQNAHPGALVSVASHTPRTMIIEQLSASPGRDLVLVRHRAGEPAWITMVANEPDIDNAEIVWAHDLGGGNRRLLAYFAGRKVWLVDSIGDTQAVPFRPVEPK